MGKMDFLSGEVGFMTGGGHWSSCDPHLTEGCISEAICVEATEPVRCAGNPFIRHERQPITLTVELFGR